jgi:hypothetical protein
MLLCVRVPLTSTNFLLRKMLAMMTSTPRTEEHAGYFLLISKDSRIHISYALFISPFLIRIAVPISCIALLASYFMYAVIVLMKTHICRPCAYPQMHHRCELCYSLSSFLGLYKKNEKKVYRKLQKNIYHAELYI